MSRRQSQTRNTQPQRTAEESLPCLGEIIMLLKSTLILMFAGVSILAMGDNAALRTDTAEQACVGS